jgi:hypothetical protein
VLGRGRPGFAEFAEFADSVSEHTGRQRRVLPRAWPAGELAGGRNSGVVETPSGAHRAGYRAVSTTVTPDRVGRKSLLPLIAGVAKRVVSPTSTRSRVRPVAGFRAYRTPAY